MRPVFPDARFLMSARTIRDIPDAKNCAEVAFWGRSNVGKSSLLNAVMQRRKLAKVSNTPGRTQMLNVYVLSERIRVIDLPGYGFAQVPASLQQQWVAAIPEYFLKRTHLSCAFLLSDARHSLKENDQQAFLFLQSCGVLTYFILTKIDKISTSVLEQRQAELKAWSGQDVLSVSAVTGQGVEALRSCIRSFDRTGEKT